MRKAVWSAVVLSLALALAIPAITLAAEPEAIPLTEGQLFKILEANQTPALPETVPQETPMAAFYLCSYTCDPCWLHTDCAFYSTGERCVRACN